MTPLLYTFLLTVTAVWSKPYYQGYNVIYPQNQPSWTYTEGDYGDYGGYEEAGQYRNSYNPQNTYYSQKSYNPQNSYDLYELTESLPPCPPGHSRFKRNIFCVPTWSGCPSGQQMIRGYCRQIVNNWG